MALSTYFDYYPTFLYPAEDELFHGNGLFRLYPSKVRIKYTFPSPAETAAHFRNRIQENGRVINFEFPALDALAGGGSGCGGEKGGSKSRIDEQDDEPEEDATFEKANEGRREGEGGTEKVIEIRGTFSSEGLLDGEAFLIFHEGADIVKVRLFRTATWAC